MISSSHKQAVRLDTSEIAHPFGNHGEFLHLSQAEAGDRSGSASRLTFAFLGQERPNESGCVRPRKAWNVQESRGTSARFPPGSQKVCVPMSVGLSTDATSSRSPSVPLVAFLLRRATAKYRDSLLNCDPTVKAVASAWPRRIPGSSGMSLWQSQKKGRLSTSAMRQMIDVLVRDAATRGLVPAQTSAHMLRHTFARNYPGDVVGLATLLGHTSLDTTRIYSQPTVEQLSGRMEQLRQNAYGG